MRVLGIDVPERLVERWCGFLAPDRQPFFLAPGDAVPHRARACRRGGSDADPGTVLLWRGADGLPLHTAVTIGDGWAIEKPAETWWTPTIVADVRDVVRVNRSPGARLERHRIVGARPLDR